jgi:hypothetical protein
MSTTRERTTVYPGDGADLLVAFKTWRIVDGELRSRFLDVAWPGPVLEADCYRDLPTAFRSSSPVLDAPHTPPHPRCSCGVHVALTPDLAAPKVDFRAVTGIVAVWGGALPAPAGQVRAASARLCALGLYAHAGRRQRAAVARIGAELEADVIDARELQIAAKHYGKVLSPAAAGA